MASVAICTAVSKPNVTSVPERSLSIVFGHPDDAGTPCSPRRCATPRVSSPPMAMMASRRLSASVRTTWPGPRGWAKGLVLDVPRIVPPGGHDVPAPLGEQGHAWSSSTPRQPSKKPMASSPCIRFPVSTTARMTAFSPGQSPPPVRIPMRTIPPGDRPGPRERGRTWVRRVGRGQARRAAARARTPGETADGLAPGGTRAEIPGTTWYPAKNARRLRASQLVPARPRSSRPGGIALSPPGGHVPRTTRTCRQRRPAESGTARPRPRHRRRGRSASRDDPARTVPSRRLAARGASAHVPALLGARARPEVEVTVGADATARVGPRTARRRAAPPRRSARAGSGGRLADAGSRPSAEATEIRSGRTAEGLLQGQVHPRRHRPEPVRPRKRSRRPPSRPGRRRRKGPAPT